MDRPCFQYTRFVDINEEGKEVEEKWGYRLYDDLDAVYNNTFDSFEELKDVVNRKNLMSFLMDNHLEFAGWITERGIYFNDEWLTAEDLQATEIPH
jgi:hypothetical protein